MILAIDMGNSNIVVGGIDSDRVYFEERLTTDRSRTNLEYAIYIKNILEIHGIDISRIEGTIISSVVPPLNNTITTAIKKITGKAPMLVGSGMKTGLNIIMDNPKTTGSDMIVDAVAALREYPAPLIVIDMGTATTFSAIDAHGALIGKAIFPGAEISLEALSQRAALLPAAAMGEPGELIATGTMDAMRSGLIYGYASMVDGMSARFCEQLGEGTTLVATGALSKAIVPYCRAKITLDEHLALDGLYHIYCKNAPHSVRE